MKIYHSIEDFPSNIKTVVTIGTFDGVHKGHKAIIDRINEIARKDNMESVLLTFHPHPRNVLFPDDQELRLINTIEEKKEALRNTSLQNLIIHKFTKEFSRTKSVNFIRDVLVNKLNMKCMVVGFNHHFGKNREGTYDNLLELSELYEFRLERIESQNFNDVTISSTKIRNAIKDGDIKKANSYLCYDFSISGKIVEGNKIGSSIGFPTANIKIYEKCKVLPKDGVYAVKVYLNNNQHYAMLNIGERPTIGDNISAIEVYIFNFSTDIYGAHIKVEFVKRIREERRFDDLEALRSQLRIDAINCKQIFSLLR
ncbi:bifunctional riboflavin kinase/FAD synthetase [Flavobacteriales bacterium]|nr:bifunctional riboflavin kinase/FAD synthetase [Flavobacteriales bacterium]